MYKVHQRLEDIEKMNHALRNNYHKTDKCNISYVHSGLIIKNELYIYSWLICMYFAILVA